MMHNTAASPRSDATAATTHRYMSEKTPKTFFIFIIGATFFLSHTESMLLGPVAIRYASTRGFVLSSLSEPSEDKKTYNNDPEMDQQINKELAKAKSLIEKSKAKLKAREADGGQESSTETTGGLPFFAKRTIDRERIVKAKNETTGLITADGEAMAAISEQEDWEARPINEVFESEVGEKLDKYSVASQQLAQRDVAASVWNLRKQLQNEDYQKIFDKRNYFIGEDN